MDKAAAAIARLPVFDRLPNGRLKRRVTDARTRAGFLGRYSLQYSIFGTEGAEEMIATDLGDEARLGRAAHYDLLPTDELSRGSAIERVTALCIRGYTCNQLLRDIDAVSMSHSLEVRVPYLDTVLVDMALSLPDSTKLNLDSSPAREHDTYRSNGAKRILVDVGRPLLPPDFDLQPKRGFAMPFDSWLRGPLKEIFLDTLSNTRVTRRGWFDAAQVDRLKTRFLAGEEAWARPWLLLMTELWGEAVLDSGAND
jgi:asparagine synthase (glutamine-hydrolysing)